MAVKIEPNPIFKSLSYSSPSLEGLVLIGKEQTGAVETGAVVFF